MAALTDKQFAQQLLLQLAQLQLEIAALPAVSTDPKAIERFVEKCRRAASIGEVLASLRVEE